MNKQTLLSFMVMVFLIISLSSHVYSMPILTGSTPDGTTWTATDASGRSAEAKFTLMESTLILNLTNTATTTKVTTVPNEILVGLFFDFGGSLVSPLVTLPSGSMALDLNGNPYPLSSNNLSGEWAWRTDISGINGGLGYYGISSSAYDPEAGVPVGWDGFGSEYIIDDTISYHPVSPNGAEFGLVGLNATYDANLPNSLEPLVQSSTQIAWSVDRLDGGDIGQVNFLYGTDFASPPVVTEPATLLLMGTLLVGLVRFSRKFKRQS